MGTDAEAATDYPEGLAAVTDGGGHREGQVFHLNRTASRESQTASQLQRPCPASKSQRTGSLCRGSQNPFPAAIA